MGESGTVYVALTEAQRCILQEVYQQAESASLEDSLRALQRLGHRTWYNHEDRDAVRRYLFQEHQASLRGSRDHGPARVATGHPAGPVGGYVRAAQRKP
jgi:hypothetical protein